MEEKVTVAVTKDGTATDDNPLGELILYDITPEQMVILKIFTNYPDNKITESELLNILGDIK